jgi:hypothetical protein
MKIRFLGAFCTALLLAAPAYAAPEFNMTFEQAAATRTVTVAALVNDAAKQACERPFIRDVKGQALYRDCLASARAEALKLVEQRASAQLASR